MTTGPYAAAVGLVERCAAAFVASVPDDPADDGFFGPGSVTWRLHADLSAPVSGLRSLLLQALHPLAMAGVDQHSHWRDDPVGRFASTSAYVLTTTYGDRAAAAAAAQRVRKIHEYVRGTDPVTGKPYEAERPRAADLGARGAGRLGAGRRARCSARRSATADADALRRRDDRRRRARRGARPASSRRQRAPPWLDAYLDARPARRCAASPSTADTAATCWTCPTWSEELAELWQVPRGAAVAVAARLGAGHVRLRRSRRR